MFDPIAQIEHTGERFSPTASNPREIAVSVRRYLWVLPFVEGKRVLELGCGNGLCSCLMGGVAKEVLATDYSGDALRYARRWPTHNVTYLEWDYTKGDIPEGQFDTAVTLEFLEHLHEPELTLQGLRDSGIETLAFSLPLNSLTISAYHHHKIRGMKDVHDLIDPYVKVDRYEVLDRRWVVGYGPFRR